jgi:hypothetical protein
VHFTYGTVTNAHSEQCCATTMQQWVAIYGAIFRIRIRCCFPTAVRTLLH